MADEIIENGLRNKVDEIWGVESVVAYPGKYAGAADLFCVYENIKLVLISKMETNCAVKAGMIRIICN